MLPLVADEGRLGPHSARDVGGTEDAAGVRGSGDDGDKLPVDFVPGALAGRHVIGDSLAGQRVRHRELCVHFLNAEGHWFLLSSPELRRGVVTSMPSNEAPGRRAFQ